MRITPLLSFCALFVATATAAATSGCPELDAPPAPSCVATGHGWAYADTVSEATIAARAQRDAAQLFETHFGHAPVGVLILSTTLDPLAAREFARVHGLEYAKVWLPVQATRAMTVRAMRQAGAGRARISQALARASDQNESVLRHELGHAMYEAVYWPDAPTSTTPRYGTPAPDWLDEAAATLLETPETQARQLAAFIELAAQHPRAVPSLADFIDAEHPVMASLTAHGLPGGPKSGSGVQMSVVTEADAPGTGTFYGQSLLLALFLAETSGEARILAQISAAIAGGATFEQWLVQHGSHHGLPDTLPALQSAWEPWLRQVIRQGRSGSR